MFCFKLFIFIFNNDLAWNLGIIHILSFYEFFNTIPDDKIVSIGVDELSIENLSLEPSQNELEELKFEQNKSLRLRRSLRNNDLPSWSIKKSTIIDTTYVLIYKHLQIYLFNQLFDHETWEKKSINLLLLWQNFFWEKKINFNLQWSLKWRRMIEIIFWSIIWDSIFIHQHTSKIFIFWVAIWFS